jgi:hypothetical protein
MQAQGWDASLSENATLHIPGSIPSDLRVKREFVASWSVCNMALFSRLCDDFLFKAGRREPSDCASLGPITMRGRGSIPLSPAVSLSGALG